MLKHKIAIVTGGAQNIGLAIVKKFIENQAKVIIADLNPPSKSIQGGNYHHLDVTDEESVKALYIFVKNEYGSLDILVNNAGISIEKEMAETELTEWEKVMAVNVTGVFLCSKHAVRFFRQQAKPQGVIVNIGSIEGLGANPAHAAYGASKGAVHSLTRNIAIDHGKDGIRCNAVAPGWINTPFNTEFVNKFPDPANALKQIQALHPQSFWGMPSDVGELAVWLSSEHSRFVNGQIISLDGARTAKLPLPAL